MDLNHAHHLETPLAIVPEESPTLTSELASNTPRLPAFFPAWEGIVAFHATGTNRRSLRDGLYGSDLRSQPIFGYGCLPSPPVGAVAKWDGRLIDDDRSGRPKQNPAVTRATLNRSDGRGATSGDKRLQILGTRRHLTSPTANRDSWFLHHGVIEPGQRSLARLSRGIVDWTSRQWRRRSK